MWLRVRVVVGDPERLELVGLRTAGQRDVVDEEIGDDVCGPVHGLVVPVLASSDRDGVGEDMDVIDELIGVEEASGELMGRVSTVQGPR